MSDQKPLQTSYGNPYMEMHQPEVVSERTEIHGVKFLTEHEWYVFTIFYELISELKLQLELVTTDLRLLDFIRENERVGQQ